MQARALARLRKEADDIQNNFTGMLDLVIQDETMMLWHIKFTGAEGTVYAGENFTL